MLQFHVNRLFGLKFKTHGVAVPQPEGLQLVFREGVAERPKIMDQEIKSVMLRWGNIAELKVAKGFLSTELHVRLVDPSRVEELPGLEDATMELQIHRSNLDQIEPFERKVQQMRAGAADADVDAFVDEMRDFLNDTPSLEDYGLGDDS